MSTVHTGTVWQVPCPLVGVHTYRRPVVSIDVANDLERELEKLREELAEARRELSSRTREASA